MNESVFYAGAARADITPWIGTCLFGYRPGLHSTSMHDPLNVTALALRQGDATVMLMTITVCEIQTALCDELRGLISKECGIPAGRVILSATHTHSAPNVAGMEGWGDIDRTYVDEILIPALKKAAWEAMEAMVPAELAVGEISSQVGVNRRQPLPDGRIDFGQNPWGCYDPNMTCVAIREANGGKGILNLIHYGCHGTCAGQVPIITRDWSGVMCDGLEKITGIMTAFWNGTEGDIGPRLTNGKTTGEDIRYVEELGAVAAADALRAYRAVGGYHPGDLKLFEGEVKIPYQPLMSLEAVRAKIAEFHDRYGDPERLYNVEKMEYSHYCDVEKALLSGEEHPEYFSFPQTLVSLGDVLIVPFPFEFFSEISMRLRDYSPFRYTLALSCTNGCNAYLPTESELCRGGYEVKCFQYNSTYPLADNADQAILDSNLALLKQ